MAIYTVHVPRGLSDPFERADQTAFVRDGFSLWAFLFGPLYLLRHRAWIAAAAWIVVVVVGGWLCHVLRLPPAVETGLALLVALFTGLEANSVRRLTLHWRGLDVADVVGGRGRDDSERAFFLADTLRLPGPATLAPRPSRPPAGGSGVIGLFPGGEA